MCCLMICEPRVRVNFLRYRKSQQFIYDFCCKFLKDFLKFYVKQKRTRSGISYQRVFYLLNHLQTIPLIYVFGFFGIHYFLERTFFQNCSSRIFQKNCFKLNSKTTLYFSAAKLYIYFIL